MCIRDRDYPWQPDVRIQYTFRVWWIIRRSQRKRIRVITVQISATAPVDLLRSAIEFAQPARKRDSNASMSWSDSTSYALSQFLKEIRYNDIVLDRMKQARIFSLPKTYIDDRMTLNEHKDDRSNDAASFLHLIGGLNLKLWHR